MLHIDTKGNDKFIKSYSNYSYIKTNIRTMLFLNEYELNDIEKLGIVLRGKGFDLVLVPRGLNKEELDVIRHTTMDGIGKGIIFNYMEQKEILY